MAKMDPRDAAVKTLLDELAEVPARDPQDAAAGRARFLTQAKEAAQAVSAGQKSRHTGWQDNFFERIWNTMKLQFKWSTLAAVIALAAIVFFVASHVTTVSAQQILDRAAAVQAHLGDAIQHSRIEIFTNPKAVEGAGSTTIVESYEDTASGRYRSVTTDPSGALVEVSATDGIYEYYSGSATAGQPLVVERLPYEPKPDPIDPTPEATASADGATADAAVSQSAQRGSEVNPESLFDYYRKNPRMEVAGKETWIDGSTVYVLIDRAYQTKKSPDGKEPANKTFTGALKMLFDVNTYQLRESVLTTHKDGKDIVISSARYLVDEGLPADSPVAWDLSDLPGITFVDGQQQEPEPEPQFASLTEAELAAHPHTYLLRPLPAGWSEEIGAVTNQPADQPYAYEAHYSEQGKEVFSVQAVGLMDEGFVPANFYDGSYKTASGALLSYSTSGTSAMLVNPDGYSFLVFSSLPREQIQALVENFVPVTAAK